MLLGRRHGMHAYGRPNECSAFATSAGRSYVSARSSSRTDPRMLLLGRRPGACAVCLATAIAAVAVGAGASAGTIRAGNMKAHHGAPTVAAPTGGTQLNLATWLHTTGLSDKQIEFALAVCEEELLESVDNLRKMAADGVDGLVDQGFKKVMAKAIVDRLAKDGTSNA
eukprot:SAG22_NODE_9503_length_586_cov_1.164271_1_plen_167_part_01